MVKVTLNGNYNIPIADMGLEFTPDKNEKIIPKSDYDKSADFKYFAEYFTVEPVSKDTTIKKKVAPAPQANVYEVPSKPEEETEVIDATDASRSASSKKTKEVVEAKQDAEVIDATGASRSETKKETVVEKKVEVSEKKETVKTEPKTTEKKKAGRPKKSK